MDDTIDIAGHLGAVTRTVRRGERDGRPTQTVVAERTYDTSIDDVSDAITSAERIPRWLLPISGELRLGGRYQLEGNAGGEITACEPPRRLAVTWEFGGALTWVDVRLSAVPGGSRLALEHTAHPGPEWEAAGFGPGMVGIGWDLSLLGLALHVTSGAAIDPAQARAWQVSDEARQFMRGSSDAWCDADVAAGTPADAARAAADRTTGVHRRRRLMHAFDVLGDPVRRRIVELLAGGEHSSGAVVEVIREEFGLSQPCSRSTSGCCESTALRDRAPRRRPADLRPRSHAPPRSRRLAQSLPRLLEPAPRRPRHRDRTRQALPMTKPAVYAMSFARAYSLSVAKAARKGRTRAVIDELTKSKAMEKILRR